MGDCVIPVEGVWSRGKTWLFVFLGTLDTHTGDVSDYGCLGLLQNCLSE